MWKLCLLLLAGPYHVDADFRFKDFNGVQNILIRMTLVSDVTDVASSSRCALECLDKDTFCEAFQYDLHSETCYLGSWTWFNGTGQEPHLPLFSTWKRYCDVVLGYNLTLLDDQGMCVFLSPGLTTYNNAKTQCKEKQGRLLIIETPIKKNLTDRFLSLMGYTNDPLWVGMERAAGQRDFVWVDQEPVNLTEMMPMFAPGQPDVNAQSASCVVIMSSGLDDVNCTGTWGYLCEYVNHGG